MTEAEVEAAAAADPDARPMSAGEMKDARRVPRTSPLGTSHDWEQGRTQPDQPARAYLAVIAHDPEGVRKALIAGIGTS
ncbi:MAG: transcriptional regulator [Hyphomicrobiales bacterium]|nr:transcriptional regulator [Hyphomicrobiales bacterium]